MATPRKSPPASRRSRRSGWGGLRSAVAALAVFGMTAPCDAAPDALPAVTPLSGKRRGELKLDLFYQKILDLDGLPVLGSARVSDAALREAAWIVRRMLAARPEILGALKGEDARIVVMAHNEYTTDVPEQADWQPKEHWDKRARGMGGRIGSCGEENLLGFPGDPYGTENILIHEFAHTIHGHGLNKLIPDFDKRLKAAYDKALKAGLWKGTYAAENHHEYWAEGVQCWFDNNRENDAIHNAVNTRAELREYDPGLAALCEEVLGDGGWRYQKPRDRAPDQRAHLAGFDFTMAPTFTWRQARASASNP